MRVRPRLLLLGALLAALTLALSHRPGALAASHERILDFESRIRVHGSGAVTVTELRAQTMTGGGAPGEQGRIAGALGRSLANLFAVAENYPDLKANQNFMDLQGQLAEIEEQIQLARRYYNGATRNLNIACESFPSVIIARMFAFSQAEFFEIEDAEDRAVPEVSFAAATGGDE